MLQHLVADRTAVAGLQHDRVADFHIAQHRELRIAMRGDHAVANRFRRRGTVDMAWTERHRAAARAGQHDVALPLAGKFDLRYGPRIGPSPRLYALFAVKRSRPRSLEQNLR